MKSENDLRAWLKKELGDRVFWIEPAGGATPGMPDTMILVDGGATTVDFAPVELKFDEVWKTNDTHKWFVNMRPAQLGVARLMTLLGGKFFVLVGSELGDKVYLTCFSKKNLNHSGVKNGDIAKMEPVSDGRELMNKLQKHLSNG